MNGYPERAKEALRTQLWPVPAFAVVLAVAAGVVLPVMDATVGSELPGNVTGLLFSGGPEAARSMLEAIAGSLITVTSLTFSLTVVTLQLASSQFSPRLLRTFTRDRFVHVTLALFLATFAFTLTVLRSVRAAGNEGAPFVPAVSVTVAFTLTIASVIGLVLFLAHLTREIRVETMMRRVNVETQETIDRVFPSDRPQRPAQPSPGTGSILIESAHSGFLTALDIKSLERSAHTAEAVIWIEKEPGDSLVEGVPFARAWPLDPTAVFDQAAAQKLRDGTNSGVETGFERTNLQDVGFGFRQLVDVATRALSPGINDPTTAVHVIGHLSVLLCRLATRDPGPELVTDEQGRVRVVIALPDVAGLLHLAMGQPRMYGASDPVVAERLLTLLQEVSWCDRQDRYRPHILEELARMREAIRSGAYLQAERQRLLDIAQKVESGPGRS